MGIGGEIIGPMMAGMEANNLLSALIGFLGMCAVAGCLAGLSCVGMALWGNCRRTTQGNRKN